MGKPHGVPSHAIAKDPPALTTATKISPEHAAALANADEAQDCEQPIRVTELVDHFGQHGD
jgi:hypothetical protein